MDALQNLERIQALFDEKYPSLKDRRVFEGWLAETPWGKLFQVYARASTPEAMREDPAA